MERLLLAIDGGGSTTDVALLNEDGIRYDAQFETTNPNRAGYEAALQRIFDAITVTHESSGFSRDSYIASAVIGLAGIDTPEQQVHMHDSLRSVAKKLDVRNDSELLFGALPGQTGVATIAGTGSIATGKDATGRKARAGGHGHDYDEGSGTWIAHTAFSVVAKVHDGRLDPESNGHQQFHDEVLHASRQSLDTPVAAFTNLYGIFYDAALAERKAALYRDITPVVFDLAEAGVATAQDIVRKGAEELAMLVKAVSGKLALQYVELAVGGSLLTKRPAYRDLLLGNFQDGQTGIKNMHVVAKPLDAAVALVRQASDSQA